MRRLSTGILAGAAVTALATAAVPAAVASPTHAVAASSSQDSGSGTGQAHRSDDLQSPLSKKRRAMKKEAVAQVVKGEAQAQRKDGEKVVKLAPGQYVQMSLQDTDQIFTILTEFGDKIHPDYGGPAGPVHNQIPKPDRNWDGSRTDDNTTYWKQNFDRQHYLDMFFNGMPEQNGESLQDYYEKMSSGRYSISGDVSNWVAVPYNEGRYGTALTNANMTAYIDDTADSWYGAQRAKGMSDAEIKDYLARFDRWDRYDHDGDGDFNESDGYLDHFQAIHAGEGQEAGAPPWAIWSHRWYVNIAGIGSEGPGNNNLGGVEIGDTGYWVGDYTTEPENGGLGVFAHEYAHDLGLPDEYETAGGDNGTGFWTLMSSGSWLGHGQKTIGTTPGTMSSWDKLMLGWLDYRLIQYGKDTKAKLGIAERTGKRLPQALVVSLPDQTITTDYNTPHSGQYEWWGGAEDGSNTTLTRTLDLTGASQSAALRTWAWYHIEPGCDCDRLFAEVSTDGGSTWDQLAKIHGISGGGEEPAWTQLSFDLSDYAGQKVKFRFRSYTDGAVHFAGAFLDDLSLTVDGATAWSDDVESGTAAWASGGWTRMTGSTTEQAPHYYVLENRRYVGYDKTLQTGPYNWGWSCTRPSWVEHEPYQDGLLVWYANYAYENNNTSKHPGSGLILPVDARPDPMTYEDGSAAYARIQPFDATFGLEPTDPVTLHEEVCDDDNNVMRSMTTSLGSQPAVPTFDDSDPKRYWSAENPQHSVQVAGSGTRITVESRARGGAKLKLDVSFTD